jgi:hypothetical protein
MLVPESQTYRKEEADAIVNEVLQKGQQGEEAEVWIRG